MRSLACVLLLGIAAIAGAAEPADFRAWIKSPEAYFATSDEISAWAKISSKEDAERFIQEYWSRRGPDFRKAVLTRIEKADELFALGDLPGSRTPKGRVFILLGSPTREKLERGNTAQQQMMSSMKIEGFQNNSVEQAAVVTHKWIYEKGKLPADLGMPELIVNFQTNTNRNQQAIENPGLVEPFLKKVAAYYASAARPLAAAAVSVTPSAAPATTATAPAADDPLWAAGENLAGAFFDADAYIAPNEKPFYAVNFYLPKGAPAFKDVQSVLMVGLVKNAAGQQVAAVREQLPLRNYGSNGDRYVDRSFALPPGKYNGMFALFSPEGTTMLASRRVDFTVAAPTETTISQLLPTASIQSFDKQLPLDPFTFVATKYAVKGDRQFSTKDKVGFFTVISNPAGDPEPSMTMQMKIFRDGKQIAKTPPEPAPLTQTGPHTWMVGPAFEPGAFKVGKYSIEVQLKDLKAPKEADGSIKTYTAKTDFTVVE